MGKSFDVDDGFLKKVRVAQFAPGRTRVVLEVDNLSDYDAFLLPNPYRLIIDIHGKNGRAKQIKADDAGETASAPLKTRRRRRPRRNASARTRACDSQEAATMLRESNHRQSSRKSWKLTMTIPAPSPPATDVAKRNAREVKSRGVPTRNAVAAKKRGPRMLAANPMLPMWLLLQYQAIR